ncbi:odorant receptor 131-2-like [Sphaeramia orbicularis]|uniref:odorant receptor 131-2-like n=1 Tax=Sphaeramia orbicularis TaxID=375764 RepID=UPI0011816E55|nr:odorant receptor 131-2-like [Sphaeramia orbicularis]
MSGIQTNTTVGPQYRGLLELVLSSIPITLPCLVFLYINGVMLFTLRSKPVLRETCRYILLYNLLFADTLQLTLGQLLFILTIRIRLTYPLCGVLIMFASLLNDISPLTLVVMSLERYVAVCYPLRHSTVVTSRNTAVAIIVIWAFSSLNVLAQLVLLLDFPFKNLQTLQMTARCTAQAMFLNPVSEQYDQVYKYFLFVSAGVAVIASFIGVTIAATSASTDKASAHKARKTLLLHLFQLGLSLLSTLYTPLVIAISAVVERIRALHMQTALYVVVVMLPRCLSALIYGIRDNTIRPILMYYLCCQRKFSVILKEPEVST